MQKCNFQLVGCACLVLACKVHETRCPRMADVADIAANSFTVDDLQEMEQRVVKMLNFNLNLPTRDYFGGRLLLAAEATEREKAFVGMLLELSLLVSQSSDGVIVVVPLPGPHMRLCPLSRTTYTRAIPCRWWRRGQCNWLVRCSVRSRRRCGRARWRTTVGTERRSCWRW